MANLLDDLGIPQLNWKFHIDLSQDMFKKQNGLFSFTVRVHNKKIFDYVVFENKSYEFSKSD